MRTTDWGMHRPKAMAVSIGWNEVTGFSGKFATSSLFVPGGDSGFCEALGAKQVEQFRQQLREHMKSTGDPELESFNQFVEKQKN